MSTFVERVLAARLRAAVDPSINPPHMHCPLCRRPRVHLVVGHDRLTIDSRTGLPAEVAMLEAHLTKTQEVVRNLDGDPLVAIRCPASGAIVEVAS